MSRTEKMDRNPHTEDISIAARATAMYRVSRGISAIFRVFRLEKREEKEGTGPICEMVETARRGSLTTPGVR